jgi:hypothetical protein
MPLKNAAGIIFQPHYAGKPLKAEVWGGSKIVKSQLTALYA